MFKRIYVKLEKNDKLVDITDLNKEQYEYFLDITEILNKAYQVAKQLSNGKKQKK